MWLCFSLLFSDGESFEFASYSAEVEEHRDLLCQYLSLGYQVDSAFLVDLEGGRTEIPLEVFDGTSIGNGMQKPELEYQQVLCP